MDAPPISGGKHLGEKFLPLRSCCGGASQLYRHLFLPRDAGAEHVVKLHHARLAFHTRESGSIPGGVAPGFPHVETVPVVVGFSEKIALTLAPSGSAVTLYSTDLGTFLTTISRNLQTTPHRESLHKEPTPPPPPSRVVAAGGEPTEPSWMTELAQLAKRRPNHQTVYDIFPQGIPDHIDLLLASLTEPTTPTITTPTSSRLSTPASGNEKFEMETDFQINNRLHSVSSEAHTNTIPTQNRFSPLKEVTEKTSAANHPGSSSISTHKTQTAAPQTRQKKQNQYRLVVPDATKYNLLVQKLRAISRDGFSLLPTARGTQILTKNFDFFTAARTMLEANYIYYEPSPAGELKDWICESDEGRKELPQDTHVQQRSGYEERHLGLAEGVELLSISVLEGLMLEEAKLHQPLGETLMRSLCRNARTKIEATLHGDQISYWQNSSSMAKHGDYLYAASVITLPYIHSAVWRGGTKEVGPKRWDRKGANEDESAGSPEVSLLEAFEYRGAAVAKRLTCSPPTMANRVQSPAGSPDPCMWELCRTMPLVGGFSRGSPFSTALLFRRCSILTSDTLIGFKEHFVICNLSVNFGGVHINGEMHFRLNGSTSRKPISHQQHSPRFPRLRVRIRPWSDGARMESGEVGVLTTRPSSPSLEQGGPAVVLRLERPPPTKVNWVRFTAGYRPLFSQEGIMPDGAADRRVFSEISRRLPRPCIPALLYLHLVSPSSSHKTSEQ
ncbi:hypothetical protein PR048_019579 [Dryococelus australis]|uniref:Uncharacterized protein n=1 Tax=Dryococelus australis TaxID=614101 RepID=A0ABQ9H3W9_9NEOP|nr:hypothetical protein PR048_019579 [Dryococelus australis]